MASSLAQSAHDGDEMPLTLCMRSQEGGPAAATSSSAEAASAGGASASSSAPTSVPPPGPASSEGKRRRSAYGDTARLLAELVRRQIRTLVFVKVRVGRHCRVHPWQLICVSWIGVAVGEMDCMELSECLHVMWL